jgi:hypothetical protein
MWDSNGSVFFFTSGTESHPQNAAGNVDGHHISIDYMITRGAYRSLHTTVMPEKTPINLGIIGLLPIKLKTYR